MKRVLSAILLVLLTVGLFAATKVTISGWPGNPVEEGAIKQAVDTFNATVGKQKGIEVVWEPIAGDYKQMLMTKLSGGTGPDIFYVDVYVFEELARANVLLPLDTYIKRDSYDISDFYPTLVDAFKYQGRTYGIPKDFSTLALVYNKEIFDKCKVPYPTNNETWDSLLKKLQQLKKAGVDTPMVLAADFNRVIPFIISYGGRLTKPDLSTALGEPNAKKAIQFYVDLVTKYKVANEPSALGAGWIGEALATGKAAVGMEGPWLIGFAKESFPDTFKKLGFVEMPKGIKKSTMIYTVSWSINRATPNKDAAWEVVKFLTSDGQKIFVDGAGVLASRKSLAAKDTDPIKQVFYKGAEYGTPWKVPTKTGLFATANDQINSLLADLFHSKITVDQAIQTIEANYNTWISK
ncbi:MAG TPA: ABC transporter substrate-binding protein [Fervidobacterium sp.]|nr:ABC transporter substrate-binding protein [Fervidobacterium sp.]HPT53826.1 ABC transporter substrate-binding protein [Fervidobacterium sp.]HPZ17124.1 ABC transporter substrate-binding protein [Fervidobacterium sp.]HQE48185.1 ABC transporter substrate-binding protein [Fervidobacterium sp.]HUM41876.1 ABC transporter substrate-binding protein [Fervidobacterium sp.]